MASWLEISRSNLRHNVKTFRSLLSPQTKLLAVVKANAYGHGQKEIVALLQNNKDVDGFAVFTLAEALTLRRQTVKPILVLGYWPNETAALCQAARTNIILPVKNLIEARRLQRLGIPLAVQIKIDVGTRRLGIDHRQAVAEIKKIQNFKNLKIRGIYSHFADSENRQQAFTRRQFAHFSRVIDDLRRDHIDFKLNHIACTAAVLRQPEYQLQALRLGLGLYGLQPFSVRPDKRLLRPVLAWKTRILQIIGVKPGDTVGYGRAFRAKHRGYIATLPVGYYDGYDRGLSNKGEVLILGRRYPVVGRICMNTMMVALPPRHNLRPSQLVTLIGRDGGEMISADDLAARTSTINYEIITRINPLLPRIICS